MPMVFWFGLVMFKIISLVGWFKKPRWQLSESPLFGTKNLQEAGDDNEDLGDTLAIIFVMKSPRLSSIKSHRY
jgi:hypothetical protein